MMAHGVPSISPKDAAAAVDPAATPDAAVRPLIVDVREPDEFVRERVAGVVLLPISQFVERHGELPKDRPLLMLCHSGSRSTSATAYLLQSGWPDVHNITGGMIGWRYAGLPIETGAPPRAEGTILG
jgi:rhodanese-related sulfurtransferase